MIAKSDDASASSGPADAPSSSQPPATADHDAAAKFCEELLRSVRKTMKPHRNLARAYPERGEALQALQRENERLEGIYKSAVNGRRTFRAAYREAEADAKTSRERAEAAEATNKALREALVNLRRAAICQVTGLADGLTIHDIRRWIEQADKALSNTTADTMGE